MMESTLDLTIPQLNRKLIDAVSAIDTALTEYRKCNADAVELERDYLHACAVKVPRLKERLAADRERELFLQTEDEWVAWQMSKALKDTAGLALKAATSVLNGLQSVAAAYREEVRLSMYGQDSRSA